jgi:hypothetical protein
MLHNPLLVHSTNLQILLVAGDWYEVVYNKNDGEDTFSIIDNQGDMHLFCMYDSDDLDLPRTYIKWFYSIEELREMKLVELGL